MSYAVVKLTVFVTLSWSSKGLGKWGGIKPYGDLDVIIPEQLLLLIFASLSLHKILFKVRKK